ncbi:MAG TPA: NAD(P)H-binding protein [Flavobacterium sp.]|nr:NAD(P)H-binding protein [Flavobacterium sp.]
MNLLILGATGYTGQEILRQALEGQFMVTILVRNTEAIAIQNPKLKIIKGNVLDRETLADALQGQDVVIQALGIGGRGDGKPNNFVSSATALLVEAMEANNVKRLIALSNIGAGDSIAFQPRFFTRFILPYFMKWLKIIIDDKNVMEPIIMNSNLQWTIVRCPNIIDKPAKQKITATLDGKGLKLSITKSDVAKFIVQQATETRFISQAPSISN